MEYSNVGNCLSQIKNLENVGACVKNSGAVENKKRKREYVDDDRRVK